MRATNARLCTHKDAIIMSKEPAHGSLSMTTSAVLSLAIVLMLQRKGCHTRTGGDWRKKKQDTVKEPSPNSLHGEASVDDAATCQA